MLQLHCILQKWFKGCKGLKTLRFEVLDFFIIQPKLDVNPACGVQKFSPLDVYKVFVLRDLKRTPGSAHNGNKVFLVPIFPLRNTCFCFPFTPPLTDIFCQSKGRVTLPNGMNFRERQLTPTPTPQQTFLLRGGVPQFPVRLFWENDFTLRE